MSNGNNVFFEQNGRKMYGMVYGYAIEYMLTHESGMDHVCFAEKLIMPDDPQNWEKPIPTDIASECLYNLVQEKKYLLVKLYGIWVNFNDRDTLFDIKRRIRQVQKNLIKVNASPDVRNYINNEIPNLIKGMPVH